MSWQFVYRDTFMIQRHTDKLRIPIPFKALHRLIISAKLVAGLGDNQASIGSLTQLLFVPGLGDVQGDSFTLKPAYQLVVPTAEFDYKLIYQPIAKAFSVELSIWKDTEVYQLGQNNAATGDLSGVTADFVEIQSKMAAINSSVGEIDTNQAQILSGLVAYTNQVQSALATLSNQQTQILSGLTTLAGQNTQSLAQLAAIAATINAPSSGGSGGSSGESSQPIANRSQFDKLTYGATADSSTVSYYGGSSTDINQINNGNLGGYGMVAQNCPGLFSFHVFFTANCWLNRVILYPGQFGDNTVNSPGHLAIYSPSNSLLFETDLNRTVQTLELSAITALDTASSFYRFEFSKLAGSNCSILELELYGAVVTSP